MTNILICDDQEIVREGLQTILSADKNIHVQATASDGEQLLEVLRSLDPDLPDVVLLDLKMPVKNGTQATREIKKTWPAVKVLILTTYADDQWVFDALKAGASGYLLKDTPRDQLIDAIRGTAAGDTYVDPSVAGKLLSFVKNGTKTLSHSSSLLSEREREVLLYIAKGLSNSEIGAKLFLSSGTVRNYTSGIFTKLQVSDRTEAAIAGLREGLFDLDEI